MSLSTKILIWIGALIALGMLVFIVVKQLEISTRQQAIETQVTAQKQLVDGITRSQSTWATKDDMDKFISDNGVNLKAIQDDVSKLHGEITAANTLVVDSSGQHVGNLPSSGFGPANPNPIKLTTCKDGTTCPNTDLYGYQLKQQNLALNEDFGTSKVPIGTVGFSAWQQSPWNIDIRPREYHVTTVISTDENQKNNIYNKFDLQIDGKTYEIPIKTATTQQEYPTAKFSFWNPRLFLAVNGGVGLRVLQGEFSPSLNLGIMSYGKFLTTPDLSVLQVGAGFGTITRKPQFFLSPVSYNIGQHIPFMHNLYLGPSFGLGTDGNVFAMGTLSVGL